MFDTARKIYEAHNPCVNPCSAQFCNCTGACREDKLEESKPLEGGPADVMGLKLVEYLEGRIKDLEQENKRLTENNHVMRVKLSKTDATGSFQ